MLKGNQKVLDLNRNNKLDSEDFKMLRADKNRKKKRSKHCESKTISEITNRVIKRFREETAKPGTGRYLSDTIQMAMDTLRTGKSQFPKEPVKEPVKKPVKKPPQSS